MRIYIGSDNNGFRLKKFLINVIEQKGIECVDVGVDSDSDETMYPDIAKRVCEKIIESNYAARGILCCGTGIGMAMTANKFHGIFAAVGHDIYSAERSILSNNGNVLCFGAQVVGEQLAASIVRTWTGLEFKDSRSTRKVKRMREIDDMNLNDTGCCL